MVKALFSEVPVEIVPLNFKTKSGFAHPPDPLDKSNLASTCKAVIDNTAHLGICLDGDGDRAVFVDELGRIVPGDLMTALLAKYLLEDNPGALVVYDLRCSKVVPETIRAAGGVPRCERVGYLKKAMTRGQGLLAGGIGGKYYFRDNFNCDSAAIAIALTMGMLSGQDRPLSELIAPLACYSHSGEISFETDDPDDAIGRMVSALDGDATNHHDGMTFSFDDWWCNVRPSRSASLIRLNLEANTPALMNKKLDLVRGILSLPEV